MLWADRPKRAAPKRLRLTIRQAGGHAGLGPRAPIDAQRADPLAALIVGKGVKEGIRCAIVSLTGVAQQTSEGGEGDKEIERAPRAHGIWHGFSQVCDQLLQMPSPLHFRGQHRGKARLALLQHNAIV